MKVIIPGRPQNGWSKEFTCTGAGNGNGGCGAVLLVEQDDLYQTSRSFYDGSSEYYVTFKCCECGVETDAKDVPCNISNKLITKEDWIKKHTFTCIHRFENGDQCQSLPVEFSNHCYEHRLKCGKGI
jgi:hypothetical protein